MFGVTVGAVLFCTFVFFRRPHVERPHLELSNLKMCQSFNVLLVGRIGDQNRSVLEDRKIGYCIERELHGIFLTIIGAKVSPRLVSITFIINSK